MPGKGKKAGSSTATTQDSGASYRTPTATSPTVGTSTVGKSHYPRPATPVTFPPKTSHRG
ncbi:hypothetical protein BGX38DRAFT_1231247 [Terfezia claveryi]|nr:hypothetical protein BGX38DRAFT_1231247 [Terfezia claveryi]